MSAQANDHRMNSQTPTSKRQNSRKWDTGSLGNVLPTNLEQRLTCSPAAYPVALTLVSSRLARLTLLHATRLMECRGATSRSFKRDSYFRILFDDQTGYIIALSQLFMNRAVFCSMGPAFTVLPSCAKFARLTKYRHSPEVSSDHGATTPAMKSHFAIWLTRTNTG